MRTSTVLSFYGALGLLACVCVHAEPTLVENPQAEDDMGGTPKLATSASTRMRSITPLLPLAMHHRDLQQSSLGLGPEASSHWAAGHHAFDAPSPAGSHASSDWGEPRFDSSPRRPSMSRSTSFALPRTGGLAHPETSELDEGFASHDGAAPRDRFKAWHESSFCRHGAGSIGRDAGVTDGAPLRITSIGRSGPWLDPKCATRLRFAAHALMTRKKLALTRTFRPSISDGGGESSAADVGANVVGPDPRPRRRKSTRADFIKWDRERPRVEWSDDEMAHPYRR